MNSKENDAMRCNDVLSETNILICYMPKTELRMRSYDAMNIGKKIRVRDGKSTEIQIRIWHCSRADYEVHRSELAGVDDADGSRWIRGRRRVQRRGDPAVRRGEERRR